jgi:hypothetical protein
MNLINFTKATLQKCAVIFISLFCISTVVQAKPSLADFPPQQLWEFQQKTIHRDTLNFSERKIISSVEFHLNVNLLIEQLENPPVIAKNSLNSDFTLEIPLVDGTITVFVLRETNVLPPALALKYPSIKTYSGYQRNTPSNRGKFDITPHGFHGMFKYNNHKIFIDPISEIKSTYRGVPSMYSVYKATSVNQDKSNKKFQEKVFNDKGEFHWQENAQLKSVASTLEFGEYLTNYRIAISATGEYTQYHGGTVELGLAEITTAINRINQVFEVDLAVQFTLAEDSDLIIFTDPDTDPFENDGTVDIANNRTTLNTVIGLENYDIGHLFMVGGGGIAWGSVVCSDNKMGGVTGLNNPINDSFYIDYVSHEIGHQFGSQHSFNSGLHSCSHRARLTAYEPGSGSTIMSYAGLCGEQKLQTQSDAYFHQSSILQIRNYIDSPAGSACGTVIRTNNTIPFIEAGSGFTIPAQTPFILNGNGYDTDGTNGLTYTWEQFDLGPQTFSVAEMIDDGLRPLFRSYLPNSSPIRYLPNLIDLVNDSVSIGEVLPTTNRTMNFKLGVRDGQGGFNSNSTTVTVDKAAGPFQVLTPDFSGELLGGESLVILWNVANTDASNVNCNQVDISISLDDSYYFEDILVANTANDGSENITLPNVNAAESRIKVQCSDGRFFNISPINFSIREYGIPIITGQKNIETLEDVSIEILLSHLTIDDENSNFPNDFILNIENGSHYIVEGNVITPEENFNGELSINISVSDTRWLSQNYPLKVSVVSVNDSPIIESNNNVLFTDEDTDFELRLSDLVINDVDSHMFSLNIQEGDDYSIIGNNITPDANFNGFLTVQVSVIDEEAESNTISLSLQINAINDLPEAVTDSFTVTQDSRDNNLAVLNNDFDVDGDNIIISAISYDGSGMLTLSENKKNLLYSPADNFYGSDSFSYTIKDPSNGTSSSDVLISVKSNNTNNQASNNGGSLGIILFINLIFLFSFKLYQKHHILKFKQG